jgi:tetratricopeptide (TPR) repeat protein
LNIETTNHGALVDDIYYRTNHAWYDMDTEALGFGRSLTDRRFAAILCRYAASHLNSSNRPREALETIDKAIGLWPENDGLRLERLNIIYSGLGRHQEALNGYQKLSATTKSIEVQVRVGMAMAGHLQGMSQHDSALRLLRRLFRIAPKYLEAPVLGMMASSYRTLRRFDEALVAQELSTVIEGDAEDFTGLAIFYKNADRLDDAVRCLEISVKMNPENWNTRLILAGYLIRAGRDEEGWKVFKTVQKPRVGLDFYHTNMAWFYGSIGKKKEFLEQLEKALSLSQTPGILNYINTEVDFDKYRQDKDFRNLVERHRRRLLRR